MAEPSGSDSELNSWMEELSPLYGEKRSEHYKKEAPTLRRYLSRLKSELQTNHGGLYTLRKPFKVGGTAVVFKANHKNVPQELVVKFNRPGVPSAEMSMVENERALLPTLNHPNIVHVVDAGSVPVELGDNTSQLSFIIEQFIPNATPVGPYIESFMSEQSKLGETPHSTLDRTLKELASLLVQWTAALKYVHDQGYVYLDLKPDNAIVDSHGHLVIIDFGSAKRIGSSLFTLRQEKRAGRRGEEGYFESLSKGEQSASQKEQDESSTKVYFTEVYAHPTLLKSKESAISSNRVRGGIKRGELVPAFDCYALGKSILELLNKISYKHRHDAPQLPLFRSLHLLATRLLDAENKKRVDSDMVAGETFDDLTQEDYDTISYTDLTAVIRDIEKELGLWNPETKVPELATYSRQIVRAVPGVNTVLTDRVRVLLEHPVVARLKETTELGLVSLVYPTADHSRYDHIIGTYTHTASYVKSLFNDAGNPLFRNLVDDNDIKAILLASLMHDLGQYPLAHDLEEVHSGIFNHTNLSQELLDDPSQDNRQRKLLDIIKQDWGVSPAYLKQVLGAQVKQTTLEEQKQEQEIQDFKVDMLSALIDGPIDADKADYIVRDSIGCRVPYGNQLDIERLLRVLTVSKISDSDSIHRVTIAVYDKGRASAVSFTLARFLLFGAVYWHHTVRILKSMLQYATALSLPEEVFGSTGGSQTEQIHSLLRDFITKLFPPYEGVEVNGKRARITKPLTLEVDEAPPRDVLAVLKTEDETPIIDESPNSWYPGISWTDWLVLRWIKRELPRSKIASLSLTKKKKDLVQEDIRDLRYGASLVNDLMGRRLYKRIATILRTENDTLVDDLDKLSWPNKIRLSQQLKVRLRQRVMDSWEDVSTYTGAAKKDVERWFDDNMAILVDIPKSKIGYKSSRPLVFVPEMKEKSYYQGIEEPISAKDWTNLTTKLLNTVAPVRVFCHPELRAPISRALFPSARRELRKMMSEISSSLV